jgi:hypothetical protein
MSDLDAIWMKNAAADLLSKAGGHERGFDLLMSPGYFPFDVHKQMGVVGEGPNPSDLYCVFHMHGAVIGAFAPSPSAYAQTEQGVQAASIAHCAAA